MNRIIKNTQKALLIAFGLLLLALGVLGLVLPVLPGIVLILLGLAFLSKGSKRFSNSRMMKKITVFVDDNFPRSSSFIF